MELRELLAPGIVERITSLQHDMVERWHQRTPDVPFSGPLALVCQQHQYNFLLWHEEDIARSPEAGDARIAQAKRAIDGYNQQRNDHIEKVDELLQSALEVLGVSPAPNAFVNTETPGSAIDRLSIMSLRIYHMREQLERPDVDQSHKQTCQAKLDRCLIQHQDLSRSLEELLEDLAAGRKQLRLYRQMKMYNDPTLNPYLYRSSARDSQPVLSGIHGAISKKAS